MRDKLMDMLGSDCIMVIMNRVAVAALQKAKMVASGIKQEKYVHPHHVVLDAGKPPHCSNLLKSGSG